MSDMAEYWDGYKDHMMKKRAANRVCSRKILKDHGMPFEVKNDGAHIIVKANGTTADFWPGTGKWIIRKGEAGRGVFNLIGKLKESKA